MIATASGNLNSEVREDLSKTAGWDLLSKGQEWTICVKDGREACQD